MYQGKFEPKNRPGATGELPDLKASVGYGQRGTAPQSQRTAQAQNQRNTQPVQRSAPAAQRKAAGSAAPEKKGSHVGTTIFYTFYFLLIFLFFGGCYFGLNWLNGWLIRYEAAQPTVKCQEVFEEVFNSPDWGNLYDRAGLADTAYEGKDAFVAYMEEKTAGKTLTYKETSAGLSGDKKYNVFLDDEKIATFTLVGKTEKKTDIPDWQLGKIDLYFSRNEGYLIQKLDGHTAYVNGIPLDDNYTIQIASTKADEFLPVAVSGVRTCIQRIDNLIITPEVVIKNAAGEEQEVVYDEQTGTFIEQTIAYTISDTEKELAVNALKAYGEYMINAASRATVAKYYDTSCRPYTDIINMGKELWMNKDYGHRFLNDEVTDYTRYGDSMFSVRASMTMNVNCKDGSTKNYEMTQSLFFTKKDSKWLVTEMTNQDISQPVGQVRLTFMDEDTQLHTDFYKTDAATISTPMVSAPEGKVFTGWVTKVVENGKTSLKLVFEPDENGNVTIPSGTTLEPMVLYALYETPAN